MPVPVSETRTSAYRPGGSVPWLSSTGCARTSTSTLRPSRPPPGIAPTALPAQVADQLLHLQHVAEQTGVAAAQRGVEFDVRGQRRRHQLQRLLDGLVDVDQATVIAHRCD